MNCNELLGRAASQVAEAERLRLASRGDARKIADKAFNAGKLWTPEQVALLANLYNEGKSLQEISSKLGRTGSAVVGKMCQQKMLWSTGDGHYYPVPELPWAMWQEVKAVDSYMKSHGTEYCDGASAARSDK